MGGVKDFSYVLYCKTPNKRPPLHPRPHAVVYFSRFCLYLG